MKIAVIGGSGHIGSYLIPRLVMAGHQVVNISRGICKPYIDSKLWKEVQHVVADREAEDKEGSFAKRIKDLHAEIVIDNICFHPNSAKVLAKALLGNIEHLLVTGTIWVHGYSEMIPTQEKAKRHPLGEYGINKNKIEEFYLEEFRLNKLPVTIVHPGHIVGCGWPCLNPQGHFNLEVFRKIMNNQTLMLPNLGLECVHHVHAEDIAQIVEKVIQNPKKAIGESFHVVSPQAVTLRHYAESAYSWFGDAPKLEFMPLKQLAQHVDICDFHQIEEHVSRSPCMSIEKSRLLLGYEPKYSSLEACRESVEWLVSNKVL